MIILQNDTNIHPDTTLLTPLCSMLTDHEVELTLVHSAQIHELNRSYRGVDRPTDVLSFPIDNTPFSHPMQERLPLGSIIINIDEAMSASQRFGHTLQEEIALLFVHGLLHLLGYDHETDNGQMRQKEQEILAHFGLPDSLIIRSEE